ncbi:MAG: DUF3808 domain-containing protein [Bacteroidales bacterium]|nr:DUF3808 domain-containing protein [Bacteroidales bacterium]
MTTTKNIYTALLLLLLAPALAGAQTVAELVELGNQNIKSHSYVPAIDNFKKALAQNPNDEAALNGIIRAYTLSGDHKDAQRFVDMALEQQPNNAEFIMRHGILLNHKGNFDKAVEVFASAMQQHPNEGIAIQVLMNKAAAELNLNNFGAAIDDYSSVLEIDPRSTNAYSYRGMANYKAGNYKEAVDDYTYALDLDPSLVLAYYNRGMALLKLQDKTKACADFQKACKGKNTNACKMIVIECQRR